MSAQRRHHATVRLELHNPNPDLFY